MSADDDEGPEPDVPTAQSLRVARCAHGHVYLELLDVDGDCFATASFAADTALVLAADLRRHAGAARQTARRATAAPGTPVH